MKSLTNNHTGYPRLIKVHFSGERAELRLQNVSISNYYKCQEIIIEIKIKKKKIMTMSIN